MIEPEVPLKKKDQVALNEEIARNLEAQLQAELIEEEKMARKKEEEANIACLNHDNTQAYGGLIDCYLRDLISRAREIAQDSSTKKAGDKLESDKSKKQKTDENEEVEVDNEAELKMHMVIVKDDDIAIDGIDRERLQDSLEVVKTKHVDIRPGS
ncbi:hypothetical protein Tco_0792521 [Tanacetum coccineum]